MRTLSSVEVRPLGRLGVAALTTLLLAACGPSAAEDDAAITRLACIKVLRWNNDPGSRSEVYRSTLDLYADAQDGEVGGEQTWEDLVRMFTEEDELALANWESSEPCQDVNEEIIEDAG